MAPSWFTKSLYIARPEAALGVPTDLIYRHPDQSIPRGAKLTVRSSECALFFREGQFIGRMDAGTTQLDTANIPFLGHLLIDKLTDANHFLCELFFVSLNETIVRIPALPVARDREGNRTPAAEAARGGGLRVVLDPEINRTQTPFILDGDGNQITGVSVGQYRDLNSARVVNIYAELSYTVKVIDPAKLVIELSGQRSQAGQAVHDILNGRLMNQIRRVVGGLVQVRPVLDVVSNVDVEVIGEEVRRLGHAEFIALGIGIGRLFDISLTLDRASLISLREFGVEESKLALQAKGAELATRDGFAEFNLLQGQRAAMVGLGEGLSKGSSPMIMTGVNIGGALGGAGFGTGAPRSAHRQPPGGTILSSPAAYLMSTSSGETGPYSARQVALIALSKNQPLSTITLRRSDDPPEMTFTADLEPAIVADYQRRSPGSRA